MTSEIVVVYCLPLALIIFISALYRTRSVRLLQYQPRMAREFYNLDLRSINAPITHIREIAFEARLDESADDNASPTPVSKDTCGTADSENSAPQKSVNVSKSK
jgi:hypothetical protein